MVLRSVLTVMSLLSAAHASAAADALPEGDGRETVEYACSQCHGLLQVTNASKTEEQWRFLVKTMINQGAPIEEYEVDTVISYLAKHFGQ